MGSDSEKFFSENNIDILKELGNIGTGQALGALSKMINKRVAMPVPNVLLVEFQEVSHFVGGPENIIVGILVSIHGEINGIMMFLLQMDSAHLLTDAVLGEGAEKSDNPYVFNEMETSIIQEIGNIMISAYLGTISGMININIRPSVPYMSIDMANAILSVPAIEFGKVADRALFIESKFSIEGVDLGGCFIFIPDMPSLEKILHGLGVV